jgi:hypothetical protein
MVDITSDAAVHGWQQFIGSGELPWINFFAGTPITWFAICLY